MNFENITPSEKPRLAPSELGEMFNSQEADEFIASIREMVKTDPSTTISIVADWAGLEKARAAKAVWDTYSTRLHIDSFTIRATRAQHDEDPNVFQSGVAWNELD